MTLAAATGPVATGCLRCCRPAGAAERRCPALVLAGTSAHGGCGDGCATTPLAGREPATGRWEAAP